MCSHLSRYPQVQGESVPSVEEKREALKLDLTCPRSHTRGLDPRPGALFTLPESDLSTEAFPTMITKEGALNSPESNLGSHGPGFASPVTPGQVAGAGTELLSPPRMQTTLLTRRASI